MSKPLERSLSLEEIPEGVQSPHTSRQYTAIPLRNPQRDELGEAQFELDKVSMGKSGQFGPYRPNRYVLNPTAPDQSMEPIMEENTETPERQPVFDFQRAKPNKPAIHIEKFDNRDERQSIGDWLRKYERMAAANCWTEADKATHLFFNVCPEVHDYMDSMLTEGLPYSELKYHLLKNFGSDITNFDLSKLHDRKFRIGKGREKESFYEYFFDKVRLLKIFEPEMSFKRQAQYIILGLGEPICSTVMLEFNRGNPKDMSELKELIEFVVKVHDRGLRECRPTTKTVHFDTGSNTRRNMEGSRTLNPNDYYRVPSNKDRAEWTRGNLGPTPYDYTRMQEKLYQNPNNYNRRPNNFNRNPNNYGRNPQNYYNNSNNYRNPNNGWNRRNQNNNQSSNGFQVDGVYANNRQNNEEKETVSSSHPTQGGTQYKYRRTPDGIPICFICDKPGHTSFTCPEKSKLSGN